MEDGDESDDDIQGGEDGKLTDAWMKEENGRRVSEISDAVPYPFLH